MDLLSRFAYPPEPFFLYRAIFTCVGAFRTREIVSVKGSIALTRSMAGVTLTAFGCFLKGICTTNLKENETRMFSIKCTIYN